MRIGLRMWSLVLGMGVSPVWAELPPNALVGDNAGQQYLAQLRKRYGEDRDMQALLVHCNALLRDNALLAGYQVGQKGARDWFYRVELGRPGELVVREETRAAGSHLDVRVGTQVYALYGREPEVTYSCSGQGVSCTLSVPGASHRMLMIVRRPAVAQELAHALTLLVRQVQEKS